jgi:arginyl-tRNA synthetase
MIREEIRKIIEKSIKELQKKGVFSAFDIPKIQVEQPEVKSRGDYATNIAMAIARENKKSPVETAENFKNQILSLKSGIFEKIEIASPGFTNFFISKEYLQKQVEEILKKKDKFFQLNIGKGKKVNVEFISANPTGPLTLGNGRGGFCGDVLTNVLNKAGYKAKREYYINDVGEQIRKLGHSVINDAAAVYKGEYIDNLRKRVKGDNPDEVGQKAGKIILEEMIKPSVKRMGIKFDVWFSEKELYNKKEVKKVLEWLRNKDLAYEKDGALWFKSTKFKDDKDRVLIKANGETTYVASDAAYLKDKFNRGFEHLIYVWGADHYGYIERVKAMAEALGYKKEQTDFIIMQLVKLFEAGQEVRMSKRTGVYVVLDELIDEVGLDVARFFFLTKNPDTHLNFDLDLAKQQSEKNPVYYIQYAHARICSILRKINNLKPQTSNLKLLNHPNELELIKKLIQLPEIIEDTAIDYQVQRLPQYAVELATIFHQFYQKCWVITENKELSRNRLSLVLATKIVLKNTLDLMGISAPEKM